MTSILALLLALLISTSAAIARAPAPSPPAARQAPVALISQDTADRATASTAAPAVEQQDVPKQDASKQKGTGTTAGAGTGHGAGTDAGAGGASGGGDGTGAGAGAGATVGTGATESKEVPEFPVLCVHVFDRGITRVKETKNVDPPIEKEPTAGEVKCPPPIGQRLIGTGDVIIVISPANYKQLEAYQVKKGTRASLYINGVYLGMDADLVAIYRYADRTLLQYNVMPGENSKKLWAALYRAGQATTLHPLHVGLGFTSGPITFAATGSSADIAITSRLAFWIAMTTIAILVFFGVYQGYRTDIFRDAKTPDAFRRAWGARQEIESRPNAEQEILTGIYPAYNVANKAEYMSLAEQALDRADLKGMDPNKLAVGLVLARDKWRTARPSYSLGRVQLGMWFLFAIATGVFLWLIYGQLPGLDGSLLALLGLSTGLTGVSLAIDKSNPNVRFSPSQGFLKDLITSWDDQHQVYRFQAVVVNLLLLGVGIFHVSRHLTYPIFDATWLAFLGISGVALAACKSVVETKPTK